jgi:hypothetical protein
MDMAKNKNRKAVQDVEFATEVSAANAQNKRANAAAEPKGNNAK